MLIGKLLGMAAKTDDETNGYMYTFQWKIENISQCRLKESDRLNSPAFCAEELGDTTWSILMYPKVEIVDFHIHRKNDRSALLNIGVNYQFILLGKDDSVLIESPINGSVFRKNYLNYLHSERREKIFFTEREMFLPDDILTVQCKIWKKGEKPINQRFISARTILKVNRRSFVWTINKFDILKSGLKNKFKDSLMELHLVLIEDQDFETKLVMSINSFDKSLKYFSFDTSFVDFEGKTEACKIREFYDYDLKRGELPIRLFTKILMNNRIQDFPNDLLTLNCECVTSTITNLYECFHSRTTAPKLMNEFAESRNEPNNFKEISPNTAELLNDLKFMFNEAIFSDTELRTSTRTFKAHKGILSSRSPVFRRMFSNEMKEKNSGHVDITDCKEDSVHRMLLYMYTDSLEDVQFENAYELYTIADKYEILSLKSRCSSFLKENLCSENSCEVLVLADLHNDDDLKSAVLDYILGKRKEIFYSQEWNHFMETHPKLAGDVMYRKICQD